MRKIKAMYMFTREVASMEAGNKMSKYWEGYKKAKIVSFLRAA